jgi:hypothetical protein
VTSSRRSSRQQSRVDHSHVCRPLLGGQTARVGETWSCTSPPAGVIQVTIQRRRCRLLLPMPMLLTACMGDRPCHGQAALRRNTSRGARKQALGRLPMRNSSRQGAAHQCESANSCICNIHHTAPGDESPPLAETFCGIVYRATWAGVSASLGLVFLPSSAYHSCTLRRPGSRVTRAGEGHRGALPVPPGQAPGRWGAEGRGHPRQGKIHCRHGRVTTRAYNAKGAM